MKNRSCLNKEEITAELLSLISGYLTDSDEKKILEINFVKSDVLDSFSLLSFITDIETFFQIQIPLEDLSNEKLQTVSGLSEYLFLSIE